ncbi:MAG: FAD-dependent oxidoreductase [Acidobacteriota bacterium]
MKSLTKYDVAVIGAGVFGTWIAYELNRAGKRVLLMDAYGAANNRASSGGESRVIRCSYGQEEIYTRWAWASLAKWKAFFNRVGGLPLFHQTGVLWMAREDDRLSTASFETLNRVGVPCEKLSHDELAKRFPQINFSDIPWAIWEPESGALMARRAVQSLLFECLKTGVEYVQDAVVCPVNQKDFSKIETRNREVIQAQIFIFACGSWLPKLFPEVIGERIQPTKQEVYFFGVSAGDKRFAPPAMPVWGDFGDEVYGIPDLENRGFKIAIDRHGELFDPDFGLRETTAENLAKVRAYLAKRFPALHDAPVLERRVCQYENTSKGDFLIDRHPQFANVWLVGGGSGHGFKHGPALGEYVAKRVIDEAKDIDPRFTLATKENVHQRAVY